MGIIKATFPKGSRKRNPRPQFTLQEKTRQILQYRTQKEAAKILGVTDRTIRRWLKGDTKEPSKSHKKVLDIKSRHARRRSYRHGSPKNIPVPPPIKRVGTQDHALAKKLTPNDKEAYIFAQASQAKWARFLVQVPKTPGYEHGIKSTGWANLGAMTGGDIKKQIAEVQKQGNIIEIITD